MAHRFGLVTGDNDLVGFWGASNIRIGVAYSILDRVAVGFGTTKDYRLQDFNLKFLHLNFFLFFIHYARLNFYFIANIKSSLSQTSSNYTPFDIF